MRIFNFLLSFFKLNKGELYRDLVILSSISQNLRRPIRKKSFKESLKKIYLYLNLFRRIISIYSFKHVILGFATKRLLSYKKDLIIVYPNEDKWILHGIAKDLFKELTTQNLEVNYIPVKDLGKYLSSKNFLFISHTIAQDCINKFPSILKRSSVLILHLRTFSKNQVELLSRFKYILCQSSLDQMRLSSLGFLPGRVINFPVGVDNNLFYKTIEMSDREYDFVISTPYKIDDLGSHYWLRKSTPLLVEIIKKLSSKGYKLMILGDNWEKCNVISKNIKIFSPSYKDKSHYLNQCKCFINISILEGGPVTLLESISCGCFSITKNCGLGHQLSENFNEICRLIPNHTNPENLTNEIIKIYDSFFESEKEAEFDSLKLQKYTYKGISIKLKKIFFE